MWYFVIVHFNWVLAFIIWGLNRWRKGKVKGIYFIAAGSILELFALFFHWMNWYRLEGEPDQIYVWIAPLPLAIIAFSLIIAGIIRLFSVAGGGDLEVANDTDIA